jgi:hypothetical protein
MKRATTQKIEEPKPLRQYHGSRGYLRLYTLWRRCSKRGRSALKYNFGAETRRSKRTSFSEQLLL